MLQTLKLLLPALIPSWRFFDTIAASPRIEFSVLKSTSETSCDWQEFRPRPAHLPVWAMLKRLFWNPQWNETMFLVSCAERLMDNPTEHSCREILNRIKADLEGRDHDAKTTPYVQFRLVFVSRKGREFQKRITYKSPIYRYLDGAD